MNVLIAIDSSASAHAALAATLARAWPEDTEFRVVTVLGADDARGRDVKAEEKAHQMVCRATTLIEDFNPKCVVVGQIDRGDPAERILTLARAWAADLVIVGSHDRGPFERLLVGSVSRKVLDSAPCSVLVARNFDYSLNHVLIPMDDSVDSKLAFSYALRETWSDDTRFHLVSVVDPPAVNTFEQNGLTVIDEYDHYDKNIAETRAALEEAVRMLGEDRTTFSIQHGIPREVILETARDWPSQLILIGASSTTGLKARLFGCLSTEIATQAECSVHVVRANVVELEKPTPLSTYVRLAG